MRSTPAKTSIVLKRIGNYGTLLEIQALVRAFLKPGQLLSVQFLTLLMM
jgi:hypothetical protein